MSLNKENDPISIALKNQFVHRKHSHSRDEDVMEEFSIDSVITSSARRILESKVEFELVPGYSSAVQENLKGKYKILVPPQKLNLNSSMKKPPTTVEGKSSSDLSQRKQNDRGISPSRNGDCSVSGDPSSLPVPSLSLYPENAVKLGWDGKEPIGAGMINLGNTCYLNSTLQALFHVPAFCNWLASESVHNGAGKCQHAFISGDMCIICAMAATLRVSRSQTGGVIKPSLIYGRLKCICKHFSHGRQEDAHEFLRFLIDCMERTFLLRFKSKKLDHLSKETTPLHRIFGGYLRNEVTCHSCGRISTTFQLFQDLYLDIRHSDNLLESIQSFFSREKLEEESKSDSYRCERCKKKGNCSKRVFIQVPPKVLCIQLKRFTALGKKIMKHISYPLKIDLSPYMYIKPTSHGADNMSPSKRVHRPIPYKLASIVSHYGSGLHCGHYTSVGRSYKGEYCMFDDSQVMPVALNVALRANAYILMYEMEPGWNIGLKSKANPAVEKMEDTPKNKNSLAKSLFSSGIFQTSRNILVSKSEIKSNPTPKLITSSFSSENIKSEKHSPAKKNLNSSISSDMPTTSEKSTASNQENSSVSEDSTKTASNGLLKTDTSEKAAKNNTFQKETKIKNSVGSFELPLPGVQKKLVQPKLSDLSNGAHTFSPVRKEHFQSNQLQSPKSSEETVCNKEIVPVKKQTPPVSPEPDSNVNKIQRECLKEKIKSNFSQHLKRSFTSLTDGDESKQITPVRKKQLTLHDVLSARKNHFVKDDHVTKTSSLDETTHLKTSLEKQNRSSESNGDSETKIPNQPGIISTSKCSVTSTVGGWKITDQTSSSSSDGEVSTSLRKKRKKEKLESGVARKKKRCDMYLNGFVQQTIASDGTLCIKEKNKTHTVNGKHKHKRNIGKASILHPFINLTKQNSLI